MKIERYFLKGVKIPTIQIQLHEMLGPLFKLFYILYHVSTIHLLELQLSKKTSLVSKAFKNYGCLYEKNSLRMTAVTSLIKSQPTQNKQTQLMQNLQPSDRTEAHRLFFLLRNAYLQYASIDNSYSLINCRVEFNQKAFILTMLKRRLMLQMIQF